MHVHSEHARTALAVLGKLHSIDQERVDKLQQCINILDAELHEAHTQIVRTQYMVTTQAAWLDDADLLGYESARLTERESELLKALIRAKHRWVPKMAILEFMYPNEADMPELKIIDVFVCKIRPKLARAKAALIEAGLPHVIETVWGKGYRLAPFDADDDTKLALRRDASLTAAGL